MKSKTLALEKVASICGVSLKRVRRWVEKKGLRTHLLSQNEEVVNYDDLIDFLVQYNMPIPESVMPFKAKKILFIFSKEILDDVYIQFLISFFRRLKKEANFIVDYVSYGPNAKMKLMIFRPDLIVLDIGESEEDAIAISKFIKGTDEFRSIKVVAVAHSTICGDRKNIIENSGIDEVLPRSIEIRPMIRRIRGLF